MMAENDSMDFMNEANVTYGNCTGSLDENMTCLENSTSQFHQTYYALTSIPAFRIICYCLYGIIFVIGVSGNATVCYIVCRNKAMQTVTNLFIVNLSFSDIFLSLFATSFTPVYIFMQKWILGSHLCCIIPYAQGVSVYVSSFTLMAISIERYFAVIHPLFYNISNKCCKYSIFIIWLYSATLNIPFGLFMQVQEGKSGKKYCVESWSSELFKKVYVSMTTAFQFLIPLIVIVYCYTSIFFKLRERQKNKPGTISQQTAYREAKRNSRVNRMLILMVVIFGITWLPINIFNIIVDFYNPVRHYVEIHSIFIFTHIIAVSSACYNPLLYAWFNENFKQEFRNVFGSSKRMIVCQGNGTNGVLEPKTKRKTNIQSECLKPDTKETATHLKNNEIIFLKCNPKSVAIVMEIEK